MGKGYAAQLEKLQNDISAEATKKQSELGKLDAAIKALQEELEKQGSVLSPEARERKQQEIVRKGRERQAFLEDGQAEINRMRERAQQQAQAINGEFQVKIRPLVEQVAKDRGFDLVLDSQVAYTINKDFDITRDVIVKADDAEKAKAAAPAAAGGPAGPAGTQPQAEAAPRERGGGGEARAAFPPRPPRHGARTPMSSGEIGRLVRQIPTQYPFVLVDRILEHDPGGRLVAAKNVTGTEDFFAGHFPSQPVMPGVLILESLAQAAGIWLLKTAPDPRRVEVRVVGFDETKFRRPVVPGDQLRLEVQLVHRRGRPRALPRRGPGGGVPRGRGAAAPAGGPAARAGGRPARPRVGRGRPRAGRAGGRRSAWSAPGSGSARGTILESHVVVDGDTRVGEGNRFFPFSSIGLVPQDLKFRGETTRLEIGDRNVFREGTTVHRGTAGRGRGDAHRLGQPVHGPGPRGARLHRGQPHDLRERLGAVRPRRGRRTSPPSAASPGCTSSAGWGPTPSWAAATVATRDVAAVLADRGQPGPLLRRQRRRPPPPRLLRGGDRDPAPGLPHPAPARACPRPRPCAASRRRLPPGPELRDGHRLHAVLPPRRHPPAAAPGTPTTRRRPSPAGAGDWREWRESLWG